MPDIFVGQVATFGFQVADAMGTVMTNLTGADFTCTFKRRTGSDDYAAAAETVTIAERGTGWYEASFTPATDAYGYYYTLTVLDLVTALNPESLQSTHAFFAVVGDAFASSIATGSYCSIADVEARVGRGAFSGTTVPTSSQVLDFMVLRAARISSGLAIAGYLASPADGENPIATTTDKGKRIAYLCRSANELLAAGDAMFAFDVMNIEDPARARALWSQGQTDLDMAVALVESSVGGSPRISASYTPEYDYTTDLPFGPDTRF